MKKLVPHQLGQLARTYWQPLVLMVFALLVLSQVIAWGIAVVEIKKVDTLITQTEKAKSSPDQPKSDATPPNSDSAKPDGQTPNSTPPNPGNPGNPSPDAPNSPSGGDSTPPKPAKNIFKKEEINYIVSAIYLDKAVVNGEEVGVGQNIGKAKVKEIGVSKIVLEEENGNARTVEMFPGSGGGGEGPAPMENPPSGGGGMSMSMGMGMGGNPPSGGAMQPGRPVGNPPPGAAIGGITIERFKTMTPEERKAFRANMSNQDRQLLRQMRGR